MQTTKKSLQSALSGFAVGSVNGIFGGGGGMVAVPVLKTLLGYPEKQAHATAILVIAPVCAASAFVYALGGYLNMRLAVPLALGGLAGGYAGARLLKFLPEFAVNLIFVTLMLAAGFRMLF